MIISDVLRMLDRDNLVISVLRLGPFTPRKDRRRGEGMRISPNPLRLN